MSFFTRCPKCGQDCESPAELAAHLEKHINRGRRFFLMGALALPLVGKIELAAAPAVRLFDSESAHWALGKVPGTFELRAFSFTGSGWVDTVIQVGRFSVVTGIPTLLTKPAV